MDYILVVMASAALLLLIFSIFRCAIQTGFGFGERNQELKTIKNEILSGCAHISFRRGAKACHTVSTIRYSSGHLTTMKDPVTSPSGVYDVEGEIHTLHEDDIQWLGERVHDFLQSRSRNSP